MTAEADQKAIADLRRKVRLAEREVALANEENDALRKQAAVAKRERDEAHAAIPAGYVLPPVQCAIDLTDLPTHVVATIEALIGVYRAPRRCPMPPPTIIDSNDGPDLMPTDVVPAKYTAMPGHAIPGGPRRFGPGPLNGRDPRIVQILRAIGRPATAVEIANFAGLGTNSVYLAARKYRSLVHQDDSRPTRYSVSGSAAPGVAP